MCHHLTHFLTHELQVDVAQPDGGQVDRGAYCADYTWLHPGRLHQVSEAAGNYVLMIEDDLQVSSTGCGVQMGVDGLRVECEHDLQLLGTSQHVAASGGYHSQGVQVLRSCFFCLYVRFFSQVVHTFEGCLDVWQ